MSKKMIFIILLFLLYNNSVYCQKGKNILISDTTENWSNYHMIKNFKINLNDTIDPELGFDLDDLKSRCIGQYLAGIIDLLDENLVLISSTSISKNNYGPFESTQRYYKLSDSTFLSISFYFLPGFYANTNELYMLNVGIQKNFLGILKKRDFKFILERSFFFTDISPYYTSIILDENFQKHFSTLFEKYKDSSLTLYGKKIINNDPILLKDSMSLEDYLNLLSKDHFIYDTMLVESDFLDDNLRFFQPADICFSFSNDDTSYFDLRIKFPDNILDSVNYFYMEESDRIRFLLNRKDYAKHLALINVKTYSNAYKYMKHEYNNKLYFTPNKLEKNRIISIIERYFNKYKLNE